MKPIDLIDSLKNFPHWEVALKTYGNSHCTLIGLVVSWWITSNPQNREALQGTASDSQPKSKGIGVCDAVSSEENQAKGVCDAVFLEENQAIGILEVEGGFKGGHYKKTFGKIAKFFDAKLDYYRSLEFCILFAYPSKANYPVPIEDIQQHALKLSTKFPNKTIVLMSLNKTKEKNLVGIRDKLKSESYKTTPTEIKAYVVKNERIIGPETIAGQE